MTDSINVVPVIEYFMYGLASIEKTRGKDVVLVLGPTTSGKSTLVNFLRGMGFMEFKAALIKKVGFTKEEAAMGNNQTSCTVTPKAYEHDNWVLVDSLGFQGTETTEVRLAAFLLLERVAKIAASVRVVFLCPAQTLDNYALMKPFIDIMSAIILDPDATVGFFFNKLTCADPESKVREMALALIENKVLEENAKVQMLQQRIKFQRMVKDKDIVQNIMSMDTFPSMLDNALRDNRVWYCNPATMSPEDIWRKIRSLLPISRQHLSFSSYSNANQVFEGKFHDFIAKFRLDLGCMVLNPSKNPMNLDVDKEVRLFEEKIAEEKAAIARFQRTDEYEIFIKSFEAPVGFLGACCTEEFHCPQGARVFYRLDGATALDKQTHLGGNKYKATFYMPNILGVLRRTIVDSPGDLLKLWQHEMNLQQFLDKWQCCKGRIFAKFRPWDVFREEIADKKKLIRQLEDTIAILKSGKPADIHHYDWNTCYAIQLGGESISATIKDVIRHCVQMANEVVKIRSKEIDDFVSLAQQLDLD